MKEHHQRSQYDLKVKNAFKSYGENSVIKGLNMNVKSGSIYGLLGPSGCGKTTLLQCILGITQLDYGSIDLNANCLKDIGYMPQDLCLDETLTIKEIFDFYGSLFNMSSKEIEMRIEELHKFLQLPNMNSFIKNISGGQSRRVSLAISMLHDPKIIILDEPTVGTDPLLRHEIWTEFTKMAKQRNRTIIITTHYIEEANLADCIGFMRKGVLVNEGSPRYILQKYDTDSLEESFLIACCNQEINQVDHNEIQVHAKIQSNNLTRFENNLSYNRIKALLKKNYHVCSRDYMLLYTMILLPILNALFYCYAIGTDFRTMPITVRNEEIDILNCPYSNTDGCILNENNNQTMSCVILDYLQSLDYTFVEVEDRKIGEMSINMPNNMAFLYFPKNFTNDLATYIVDRENYPNLAYARLTRENFLFKNQIQKDMINSILYLLEKTLNGCSYNPKVYGALLEFHTVNGHGVKTHRNGIVNLYLALLMFYHSSMFSSDIMMAEKMDGTLGRSIFSGIQVLELVISMFCMNTIAIFIQIFSTCFICFVIFSNPIQITCFGFFTYILLMVLISWIGFFFGLIIGVLTPTKIGGIYMVTALLLTQFFLSGSIWPLEGQPHSLRIVSKLLPSRLVGNTMNNITLRGWNFNNPSIVIATTTTFAYNILLILILYILGKIKKNLWVLHK